MNTLFLLFILEFNLLSLDDCFRPATYIGLSVLCGFKSSIYRDYACPFSTLADSYENIRIEHLRRFNVLNVAKLLELLFKTIFYM